MSFLMPCTNKGCGKTMSPTLDVSSNAVICSECDREITNVSSFAKSQMKSLGQIKKDNKKSFAVRCPKCNKEARPIETNNDLVCGSCKKPLSHLSEPFKQMLKINLKNADKEV